MLEVGAFEAKNTLEALLDRVQEGEEVLITRHGKAIARLVPNTGRIDVAQAKSALARIRERAISSKTSFGWEDLKRDRDGDRP